MLNEQKIRVFLSLADTLNFTETANRLFITQQAVSKHISQMEDDLGFPLFVRSTHNVKLTPAGERARSFFQEEMLRLSGFISGERAEQQRLNHALRIGYNNWLELGNAISTARERFYDLYPNITHIPERQPPDVLQSKLFDGELDIILVLRRFLQRETGLCIEELAEFPMSVIINKNNPLAYEPFDAARLSAMPLLINSFQGETAQASIARARRECGPFGLTNQNIIVMPNRDSVYTAVETGEGIALACAFSRVSSDVGDIAMIPTKITDHLICARLETNRRKLVKRYVGLLHEAFSDTK